MQTYLFKNIGCCFTAKIKYSISRKQTKRNEPQQYRHTVKTVTATLGNSSQFQCHHLQQRVLYPLISSVQTRKLTMHEKSRAEMQSASMGNKHRSPAGTGFPRHTEHTRTPACQWAGGGTLHAVSQGGSGAGSFVRT